MGADLGWRRNKWGGWFNIFKDRVVGGKKIKQKEGQSLSEAMKESGKFVTKKQKAIKEELKKKIEETETSTKDSNGKDSLSRYMDKDGKLKPEREAVHQKIIEEYFEGKTPVGEGEEKYYYFTGGGSGTGKSTFVKESGKYFGKDFKYDKESGKFKGNMVKIDADDIKLKLYQYGKIMNKDRTRFSAGDLHEESSALSKRINSIATDMRYNTMLDSTGDGSPEKLLGKINEVKGKGYKVVACYGTCDYRKALDNNLNRYINKARTDSSKARYVDEKDVISLHKNVSSTLMADAKYFDKVNLYDMNDFGNIKKIASGGSGKDLVVASKYKNEYNRFMTKSNISQKEIDNMASNYAKYAEKKVKDLGLKKIKRGE